MSHRSRQSFATWRSNESDKSNATREKMANFLRSLVVQKRRRFNTSVFIRRLTLEQEVMWGLVSGLLALSLFYAMVILTQQQKPRDVQFSLEQTYKEEFLFDEVGSIDTLDNLQDLLSRLSTRSRRMQIVSSERFKEQESQVKLWSKFHRFDRAKNIEASELNLRVDSREFTLTAWVRRATAQSTGYILRKPIGLTKDDSLLQCWAWYIADPPRFEYGFHDFGVTNFGLTPDAETFQESVEASGNWSVNEQSHFETVIVTEHNISFFRDAVLKSSVPIRRRITDCEGSNLLLGGGGSGSSGGMYIGDVTFFARSLSTVEMSEIMLSGFTLDAVTSGRLPVQLEDSDSDAVMRSQHERFDSMDQKMDGVKEEVVLTRVLSQVHDMHAGPDAEDSRWNTTTLMPPRQQNCLRDWPPCRVIHNVQETLMNDTISGKQFFDLIPASVRHGATRVSLARDLPRSELVHYHLASFPSWQAQSASFSMWVEPAKFGHILAKHPNVEAPAVCWSVRLDEMGVSVDALEGTATVRFPSWMKGDRSQLLEGAAQMRHLGLVLDKDANTLRAFLDGELLGEALFPPGVRVGALDCPNSDITYIALAHSAPGGSAFEGHVQDARMYVGEALSNEDIHKIAMSEAGAGPGRECLLGGEAQDSGTRDVNGLDCSWYQRAKLQNIAVCNSKGVQEQCPVACGTQAVCYTPRPASASLPPTVLWQRIMQLKPSFGRESLFCPVEGVDVVAQCREMAKDHGRRHGARFHQTAAEKGVMAQTIQDVTRAGVAQALTREVDVMDCELLEEIVQPSCSFSMDHHSFSPEDTGEFSMLFWMKPLFANDKRRNTVFPMVTLYKAVSPPVPFIQITQDLNSQVIFRVFGRCGEESTNATLHLKQNLFQDEWVQFALTVGPPSAEDGKSKVTAMVNARSVTTFAWLQWCSLLGVPRSIEGISVVQKTVLFSPIQEHFYQQRHWYSKRAGPTMADFEREQAVIRYPRSTYEMPATLLGPPVVFQERGSSGECSNDISNQYRNKLWNATISGPTCQAPFVCWNSFFSSPEELYTCRVDEPEETFFGRKPFAFRGHGVFAEFVPTVFEANTLVRNGDIYEAENFIDSDTKKVTFLLVLMSLQHGIASNVKVISEIGERVRSQYELMYLHEIKGTRLNVCRMLEALVMFLIVCSAIDVSVQMWEDIKKTRQRLHKEYEAEQEVLRRVSSRAATSSLEEDTQNTSSSLLHSWKRFLTQHGFLSFWTTTIQELCFDAIVMVILPLVYVSLRIVRVENSSRDYHSMLGEEEGLTGVPWESREVPLDEKVQMYFVRVARVKEYLVREDQMALLGFMSGLMLLMRVLLATKLHPRIAVLVLTLRCAFDDLLHFIVLFMVVFIGFAVIAFVNFGGYREDFHTMDASFEALFEMMMGGTMPARHESRFQEAEDSIGFAIFMGLFNFLVFFVLLNFIIAIVVESFLKIKKELEDDETEEDFFSDVWAVIVVKTKGWRKGWPRHADIISNLSILKLRNFSCKELFNMFPEHDMVMVLTLLNHYWKYEPLRARSSPSEISMSNSQMVDEIERRTAFLLKRDVPNPFDRFMGSFKVKKKPPPQQLPAPLPAPPPAFRETKPFAPDSSIYEQRRELERNTPQISLGDPWTRIESPEQTSKRSDPYTDFLRVQASHTSIESAISRPRTSVAFDENAVFFNETHNLASIGSATGPASGPRGVSRALSPPSAILRNRSNTSEISEEGDAGSARTRLPTLKRAASFPNVHNIQNNEVRTQQRPLPPSMSDTSLDSNQRQLMVSAQLVLDTDLGLPVRPSPGPLREADLDGPSLREAMVFGPGPSRGAELDGPSLREAMVLSPHRSQAPLGEEDPLGSNGAREVSLNGSDGARRSPPRHSPLALGGAGLDSAVLREGPVRNSGGQSGGRSVFGEVSVHESGLRSV